MQMVGALIAGGVQAVEIIYSTPDAAEVTRQLDTKYGSTIVLGMGTLMEPEQVVEAREAGQNLSSAPFALKTLEKPWCPRVWLL
jgi:2-dehydro-3-deoxyphosphogluconate aldolase/(4S)-4-hydroxy-2-oxoglutarate aldolase